MKANELFTGALARVNRDGLCIKKDTIVEVRAVDADDKLIEKGLIGSAHCRPLDDNQFEGGIWCEYLDPIPLTPEILEKNGFSLDEYGEWYECEVSVKERNYWVNVAFRNDSVSVYDLDILTGGRSSICIHKNYVHELQHALRLCQIEKEIEL